MQVWRICKRIYVDSSFSGNGGLKSFGRWHHRGNRIVYTSQSLSLAAIEIWVHVSPPHPLPTYLAVPAEIPDDLAITEVEENALLQNWREVHPSPRNLRDLGTRWLRSLSSAVARVPSAVTPGEYNYLLNPLHSDFQRIVPGPPQPFRFDPRMWKEGPSGILRNKGHV